MALLTVDPRAIRNLNPNEAKRVTGALELFNYDTSGIEMDLALSPKFVSWIDAKWLSKHVRELEDMYISMNIRNTARRGHIHTPFSGKQTHLIDAAIAKIWRTTSSLPQLVKRMQQLFDAFDDNDKGVLQIVFDSNNG